MRPRSTANDDQPGPIARCQTFTGGAVVQSVLTCTLRTTPSRAGPRKPGHSAGLRATGGVGVTAAGAADAAPGAPDELEASASAGSGMASRNRKPCAPF